MLQYNTFYIPLTDTGEIQSQLNAFLRSHRVLQVERHAFEGGWGFCVEWIDGASSSSGGENWRKTPRIDYKEVLSVDEFERFSLLRERRKKISQEDGVPPYMVMTDAQLAEIAKMENPQISALERIEGVGMARVEKFGERLLKP